MIARRHLAALPLAISALALAACDAANAPQPAPTADEATAASDDTATAGEAPPQDSCPADSAETSGVNDGEPDLTPAPLTSDAEKGEKGARNVLIAFTRAIELKEFDQAYDLMRENARQETSRAAFADRFDGFGKITVAAPDGTIEGAAGTVYYSAPVTITGSNGQELSGEIVLSRVNDVPGAAPEQLRWRIRDFDITG
ncbi:hypothetical protein [Alteriqipengyuania sp. 357]